MKKNPYISWLIYQLQRILHQISTKTHFLKLEMLADNTCLMLDIWQKSALPTSIVDPEFYSYLPKKLFKTRKMSKKTVSLNSVARPYLVERMCSSGKISFPWRKMFLGGIEIEKLFLLEIMIDSAFGNSAFNWLFLAQQTYCWLMISGIINQIQINGSPIKCSQNYLCRTDEDVTC